jgi:hypothetical protein
MGATARKERRTYSLDRELVEYVETVRKEYRTESASSALEQIIREDKRRRERRCQDEMIAKYYSSLNDSEVEQESEWGRFAETQFPTE